MRAAVDQSLSQDGLEATFRALDLVADLDPIPTEDERVRLLSWGVRQGLLEYPDGSDPRTCMSRGTDLWEAVERNAPESVIKSLGGFTGNKLAAQRQKDARRRKREARLIKDA